MALYTISRESAVTASNLQKVLELNDNEEDSTDPLYQLNLLFTESAEGVRRWTLQEPELIYTFIIVHLHRLETKLHRERSQALAAFERKSFYERVYARIRFRKRLVPEIAFTVPELVPAVIERCAQYLEWAAHINGKDLLDDESVDILINRIKWVLTRLDNNTDLRKAR